MNLYINSSSLKRTILVLLTLLSLSTMGMAQQDPLSAYNAAISYSHDQPSQPKKDLSTWEKIEISSPLPSNPIGVVFTQQEGNFFALVSDAPNSNSYSIYFLDHFNLSAGWTKVESLSITDATAYTITSVIGGFLVTARDHNNNPVLFYSKSINSSVGFMELNNTNLSDSLNKLSWKASTPFDQNSFKGNGYGLISDAHDGDHYLFNFRDREFIGVGYNYFSVVGCDNGNTQKSNDNFITSGDIMTFNLTTFNIAIGTDGSPYIKDLSSPAKKDAPKKNKLKNLPVLSE